MYRLDRSLKTAFGLRQRRRRPGCRAVRRARVRDLAQVLGILTHGACVAALGGLPASPPEAQGRVAVQWNLTGQPAGTPAWFVNCSFLENQVGTVQVPGAAGGGAHVYLAFADFANCVFRGNTVFAEQDAGHGGGLFSQNVPALELVPIPASRVTNCTFYNNSIPYNISDRRGAGLRGYGIPH